MPPAADTFTLRRLPLPTRLVLATFLVAAGVGYLSGLVQLHFQHAPPGRLLPGPAQVQATYAPPAGPPSSAIERLLEAPSGPFNGAGSMRPAFTERSRDWSALVKGRTAGQLQQLLAEREGERLALLSWVRAGASQDSYDRDDHPLPDDLADQPLTAEFRVQDQPRRVRIRTLLERRCVDCHGPNGREEHARLFPLDSYAHLEHHVTAAPSPALSLKRLAQTTHVHLLGFALLFGATGLIASFAPLATWARAILAPAPLALQVVEVGCWWLARVDPAFALAIAVLGPVIGLGLAVQVLAGLCGLFGPERATMAHTKEAADEAADGPV